MRLRSRHLFFAQDLRRYDKWADTFLTLIIVLKNCREFRWRNFFIASDVVKVLKIEMIYSAQNPRSSQHFSNKPPTAFVRNGTIKTT